MRIGFIGLGIMGRGMAANLIKAGHDLTLYNRTRRRAEEVAKLGGTVADSPSEAARENEIVFTMLSDPPAIQLAVLGQSGVIEGLDNGSILIDCSTVDPATTRAVAEAAAARGAEFLDAPVGGSKDAAAKGELILMVGGKTEVLERVRPVLDIVSKKIVYAGPSGSGTALKLCFNLVVSHMAAALGEALVLGVKSGLKPETMIDAFMAGIIGSPFYAWKGGCIMDRDFSTNFSLNLMHKDTGLILTSGEETGVPLPISAAVNELFTMAKRQGHGEEDFCAVVKALEDLADVEVQR